VEICHLPPAGGKFSMKISGRPVASEAYAIHLLSGDT